MEADAWEVIGECMLLGGRGHASPERMDPYSDDLTESPSGFVGGTARVSTIGLLDGDVDGT